MKNTPASNRHGGFLAVPFAVFLLGACLAWGDNPFQGMGGEDLPPENPTEEKDGTPEGTKDETPSIEDIAAPNPESAADDVTTPTPNVVDDSIVSYPKVAEAPAILDAIELVAKKQHRDVRFVEKDGDGVPHVVMTNSLEVLRRSNPGFEKPDDLIETVVRNLIPPNEDVDVWFEPGDAAGVIYLGSLDAINDWKIRYAVERLRKNHARIEFDTGKDGMTIYDAVLSIAEKSGANILVNYMESVDQVSDEVEPAATADAATVDMVAAKPVNDKVAAARKVRFYSTRGKREEWRNVLRYVLQPDYTFDEKDGEVRVMLKTKLATEQSNERNAIPMQLRYVRVFHANPEAIVERLEKLSVTENSGAKIMVAPYVEKGEKVTVNSFRHNLSSSSTTLSTGGSKIGESSGSSSSSWGNLMRPKNPPAILLYDNPGNLDRLEALVKSLDVREKQVLIEAMFLSLTDTGSRKLGMKMEEMGFGNLPILDLSWTRSHESDHSSDNEGSWAGGTTGGTYDYRGRGRGTTAEQAASTTTATVRDQFSTTTTTTTKGGEKTGIAPSWSYGTVSEAFAGRTTGFDNSYEKTSSSQRGRAWSTILGPLNFKFILEMVEENGNGKVLSSPVITIGDHSEAMVHIGKVVPILKVETDISASSINSVVVEDVDWMELVTGIMMWVGPEVTESGDSVRLWVHPKISEVDGDKWEYYKEMRYPHLVSEELDTRVTVPSGGTLLLGGLIRTSKSETIKKVPLLGDIPLLGRLFRWTSTSTGRENLVILIRPTVLDDENPSTGFEAPANKIIEPMVEGSGRTLADVEFKDENDPMKRREKAILEAVGLKKKDDSSASAEADAEEQENTDEGSGDGEGRVGNSEEGVENTETKTKPEEPSVSIVVTPSVDGDETPPPAAPDSNATADDLTTNYSSESSTP